MTGRAGVHLGRAAACAVALWVLGLSGAAPAPAQQPGGAALEVLVTAAETAEPIAGAQVVVLGTRIGGLTGPQGRARISGLVPGIVVVEVRFLGYRTARLPVELRAGHTTERALALAAEPIRLREVRVEARSRTFTPGAGAEFHQRRARGIGRFFDREEIERSQAQQFSDLLRMVPGLNLACAGFENQCRAEVESAPASATRELRSRQGSRAENSCPVQYYVDGVYQPHPDVNLLRIDDIEAVEIYSRGSEAPARYSMRKSARCGVILVWMRISRK